MVDGSVANTTDGESGRIEGLTPLDRVNRAQFMLDGLAALQVVFDSANKAPEGEEPAPLIWDKVFYLNGILLRDLHQEVGAIYSGMRDGRATEQ